MNYSDVFSFPGWETIGISILQTSSLFCGILVGLRLIGRRIFAERGPQDLITIVLMSEACGQGLAHQDAGFWGAFASVATIFLLGWMTDRVPFLRKWFQDKPLPLYAEGRLRRDAMRRNMISESDLNETARERGLASYRDFTAIVLENDGHITGIERGKT